ncbi:MAG: nucleotide sugar dehydrogenase [Porticoccus sp.]|nr:nucleotide sugar dehydrogenase [Porticoccus sp.]MBQ0808531.1 nucleotide sugar dehydrogenase [Porticoccus sp.]
MDISIIGLGYVGAVSSACFAEMGHSVIGVDVSEDKVSLIKSGKSPIVEAGLDELIQKGIKSGKLTATSDIDAAIRETNVSIVCVGTPGKENGDLDLTYIERVCMQIGEALKNKDEGHIIVIRSTVLPGTTLGVVKGVIERSSGKKMGEGFDLAMNPEFLRESTAIQDFYKPPMIVVGASNNEVAKKVSLLYQDIDAKLFLEEIETAEVVKYSCNVWHAIKVCFANEIGAISKKLAIDGRRAMDIVCADRVLNISDYYMRPGFAFGGSCLPKDVRALTHKAWDLSVATPLLSSVMTSNRAQLERGLKLVESFGDKKVTILGISFKFGTDDLRESPIIELVERLLGKGYELKIYDKDVSYAKLNGANKEYICNKINHISSLLHDDLGEVIESSDVLVIGNSNPEYTKLIEKNPNTKKVVDLQGVFSQKSDETYRGICW